MGYRSRAPTGRNASGCASTACAVQAVDQLDVGHLPAGPRAQRARGSGARTPSTNACGARVRPRAQAHMDGDPDPGVDTRSRRRTRGARRSANAHATGARAGANPFLHPSFSSYVHVSFDALLRGPGPVRPSRSQRLAPDCRPGPDACS